MLFGQTLIPMQRGARLVAAGALPCSVAFVLFKKNDSHAAWRSFREAGVAAGALPCSVAFVLFKNFDSHAAWRSFCEAGVAVGTLDDKIV